MPGFGNYNGIGYITSNSKSSYRSDQFPGDIPLKAKYRAGGSAPRHNKHSDNGRVGPKRHKLNDRQKALLPPQPEKIMVMPNAYTGHTVMVESAS